MASPPSIGSSSADLRLSLGRINARLSALPRLTIDHLTGEARLHAFLATGIYKSFLDISYAVLISGAHYYALPSARANWTKIIESYVLLGIVVAIVPLGRTKLSSIVLWLLVLLSYVPMLTAYGLLDKSRLFIYATTGFWLIVALITAYQGTLSLKSVPERPARRALLSVYLVMIAVSLAVIYLYAGTQVLDDLRRDVDLAQIYAARFRFVAYQLPLKGYYLHWLALVFSPVFFTWSLLRRKWLAAGAITALQFLIAAFVGVRSYFLSLFFAAAMAWLGTRKNPFRAMSGALAGAVAVGAMSYWVLGGETLFLLVAGRSLMVPAYLTFLHYDFFSSHGAIPLAYIIKFFLKLPYFGTYPYDIDPALLIGRTYFHQAQLDAVAGIVADGYMNFQLLGLAIWAAALGLTLKVIDVCSSRIDMRLGIAVLAMPAVAIAQTYFIRVLFTTGLLWALLILYLLRQRNLTDGRDHAKSA